MSRPVLRILNVAEKNLAAKQIAKVLSGNRYNEFSRKPVFVSQGGSVKKYYVTRYDFRCTIDNTLCEMIFYATNGHVMDMSLGSYDEWDSCDPKELLTEEMDVVKYVRDDKVGIKRVLEVEARLCNWVILWLDKDPEGENICYEVIDIATKVRHKIEIWRAKVSSLTENEVKSALENRCKPDKKISRSVDARIEVDLKIGAAFTRWLTFFLRERIPKLRGRTLYFGLCQFLILNHVVKHFRKTRKEKKSYYLQLKDGENIFISKHEKEEKKLADAVRRLSNRKNKVKAIVKNVVPKRLEMLPEFPLNTTSLEKGMYDLFKMSSKQTMDAAQILYMREVISYPRSETDTYSDETDFAKMLKVLKENSESRHAKYFREFKNWVRPIKGKCSDAAHPPIHPTGCLVKQESWSVECIIVYNFILLQFLMSLSGSYIMERRDVEIEFGDVVFESTWKNRLFSEDFRKASSMESTPIPDYKQGDVIKNPSIRLLHLTPPHLSEMDLINYMVEERIGTCGTRHTYVNKLIKAKYVVRDEDQNLIPTHLGEAMIDGFGDLGYHRSEMEQKLKDVGSGRTAKDFFVRDYLKEWETRFDQVTAKREQFLHAFESFSSDNGRKCKRCEKPLDWFAPCSRN